MTTGMLYVVVVIAEFVFSGRVLRNLGWGRYPSAWRCWELLFSCWTGMIDCSGNWYFQVSNDCDEVSLIVCKLSLRILNQDWLVKVQKYWRCIYSVLKDTFLTLVVPENDDE